MRIELQFRIPWSFRHSKKELISTHCAVRLCRKNHCNLTPEYAQKWEGRNKRVKNWIPATPLVHKSCHKCAQTLLPEFPIFVQKVSENLFQILHQTFIQVVELIHYNALIFERCQPSWLTFLKKKQAFNESFLVFTFCNQRKSIFRTL